MSKKKIKCRLINKFAVKIMKLTESELSPKKKKKRKGKRASQRARTGSLLIGVDVSSQQGHILKELYI